MKHLVNGKSCYCPQSIDKSIVFTEKLKFECNFTNKNEKNIIFYGLDTEQIINYKRYKTIKLYIYECLFFIKKN